jgi:hypothetical protein
MKILIVYILIICLTSCDEKFEISDLYGSYSPIGYENNFDTIFFKDKNMFQRRVYDKNKKLILTQNGTWILKDKHKLFIESFYRNLDDDLVRFPETIDTNFSLSTYFETVDGKIQFDIGYYIGENCFQKNIEK